MASAGVDAVGRDDEPLLGYFHEALLKVVQPVFRDGDLGRIGSSASPSTGII
jgi:hypothetical protein